MQKLTKVFIVDDNQEAIEVLQRLLEKNYSVDIVGTACDAKSAAETIIQTEPDIIFIDIELPTMSGLEFCSLIRQDIKPETKVVFYSSSGFRLPDETTHRAGPWPDHDTLLRKQAGRHPIGSIKH